MPYEKKAISNRASGVAHRESRLVITRFHIPLEIKSKDGFYRQFLLRTAQAIVKR